MSRTTRLLNLLQFFRKHRYPVTGERIAEELGVSLRTVYRDITSLREQGATIEGEAGVGYILRPGFLLPPLMFSEAEIEALILGLRWVIKRTDLPLVDAARETHAKISSVIPPHLKSSFESSWLLVGPAGDEAKDKIDIDVLRQAIRRERKIEIAYTDLKDQTTDRVLWPIALAYFDHVRVLVAWCELRQGFRHFRTDGISLMNVLETRYPRHKAALLKEWRIHEKIPDVLDS